MEKEVKALYPDVIEAQKEAVLREVATLEIQLGFKQQHLEKREENADDDVKENIAKERLQHIIPLKDNIKYKKEYYDYLCNLESSDTESVETEKAEDTSKER